MSHNIFIGVIGAANIDTQGYADARRVGHLLAEEGFSLLCGGLGGVMEAACRGAKEAGGLTIGILPGTDPKDANPYVDIPIVTGLSHGRNLIIIRNSAVLVAIRGGFGTLSEIGFALKMKKPVVGLNTWAIGPPLVMVDNPEKVIIEVKKSLQHLG